MVLNINGFFDSLLMQLDNIIEKGFAKKECEKLFFVTADIGEALKYIDEYKPSDLGLKWVTDAVPGA